MLQHKIMAKRILIIVAFVALLGAHITVVQSQSGGDFTITQSVVAGGGGQNSVGGSFSLDNTLGQTVAGNALNGSPFAITSGFWNFTPTAAPAQISGHLTYANGSSAPKNVTMTLTGPAGFNPVTTMTDSSGNYSFSNVPAGADYTVTPSKTGGVNGVTAFDASLTARFAANLISLTGNQQVAADASNNAAVSAFDASLIARTAVNIPNNGIAGTWKFSPASLTFNNLGGNQTNQNLTAILVGDVSGNWMPAGPTNLGPSAPEATITVSLPIKQDAPGGPSTIAVNVGETNVPPGVFAYDLDMFFDPAVLQLQSPAFDTAGTLSSGWGVNANTSTDVNGRVHLILNAFSTVAMTGQGTLIKLKFNVVGNAGSTTPLTWQSFNFNEGDPADSDLNGAFTASSPTAANGTITGSITDDEGRPVSGAVVRLNGAQTRKTITDANGTYHFDKVETNGFYTVTPSRVNYSFNPFNRSFSQVGNQTEATFSATSTGDHANPIDTPEYFVRQQYLDFLNREPDQAGFEYWSEQINRCNGNQSCLHHKRVDVSNAFFYEQEYQQTGAYVFRLYRAAFGNNQPFSNLDSSNLMEARKLPNNSVFASDRARVVGGADLEQSQLALASLLVQRPEFVAKYPANLDAGSFVDAVLGTIKDDSPADLTAERSAIITLFNTGGRAAVMYRLADDSVGTNPINNRAFIDAEYNQAFVFTQYSGYLRRNADMSGFLFWLGQVNSAPVRDVRKQHAMVCAFITAAEYQQRFSSVVTRSNAECPE